MILAINIGNTNISFGFLKGKKLVEKFSLPTKQYGRRHITFKSNVSPGPWLCRQLNKRIIREAIICGVVPKFTRRLANDLKKILGKSPLVIGKDINVPLKNMYRNPRQLGHDRLVSAYAAVSIYGAPIIVVDFGTAITINVVSKDKEFLGGMILPGLRISLDCLGKRTALLPNTKLEKPKELIARDTKNGMLSGVVIGTACLIEGIIERIKKEIGKEAKVIATGGGADKILPHSSVFNKVDKDLTLKGLSLLYSA